MPNDLLPGYFPKEFDTQWKFLVAQNESRLMKTVTLETVNGESKRLNQLGSMEMALKTVRAGKTNHIDVPMSDRWIRTQAFDLAVAFDEWDEAWLGTVTLPKSQVMTRFVQAYNRKCDDTIIAAATGAAFTGENGTTLSSFPAAQQIAVNYVPSGAATNSGMTLGKLIQAKALFGNADVDDDIERFLIVSQQQLNDMLNNIDQVSNERYAEVKALVEGRISKFLGFTFIRSQRLLKTGNNRTCLAYTKNAIVFGDGDRRSYADILPAQSHALQLRTTAKMGAVRFDDQQIVSIICQEP